MTDRYIKTAAWNQGCRDVLTKLGLFPLTKGTGLQSLSSGMRSLGGSRLSLGTNSVGKRALGTLGQIPPSIAQGATQLGQRLPKNNRNLLASGFNNTGGTR